MSFTAVEQAIADIRAGKLVIVADDERRENEGDLIGAAEQVTAEMINFMATHARGLICMPLTPEGLAALGRERHADEPAGVRRHEVDHLGGHLFGRTDQIPFVLAPLVIGHDDELTGADVRDRLFYRCERHSCLTYFPSTSASTCTRSPLLSRPNVVCARVKGTSDTCTIPSSASAFTVRLTPSTVMAPWRTVVSSTSGGTRISTSIASSTSATPSTVPTPSTWPSTKCPPNRSPALSARSRLTLRPFFHSPINVRPSVVCTACTVKAPLRTFSTVRQAPLTAILSPFFTPLYDAFTRSSTPLFTCTASILPSASTIPVNIAVDPRPIMYQSPGGGAPRPPSVARRRAEMPECLGKRAPRPLRARRATAPSTGDRPALRSTVWSRARPRPHITTTGSRRAAVGQRLGRALRGGRRARRCLRAPTHWPSAPRATRRPTSALPAPSGRAKRRGSAWRACRTRCAPAASGASGRRGPSTAGCP